MINCYRIHNVIRELYFWGVEFLNKRIVVVGAGYAGILTAKKLAKRVKKLGKSNEVEITIIDKNPFHTMLTELHEVAAWRVEEDSIKISLERVFAGRKVTVATDTIESIDYSGKTVRGKKKEYGYDYLVVATGSQPIYFGVEGAKEHTFTLWSYEDAVILREHIMNMFRGAVKETDAAKRRKMLTFVVVGAGFTGVEMIGELAELVPSLCDRFEIPRDEVTLVNTDMLDRPCMMFTEKLSAKIVRRLEKMRVKVQMKAQTTKIGEGYMEYKLNDKTGRIDSDTIIWTAGIEGSELAKNAEAIGGNPRGRIQTDEYLRAQNDKSVYIGGDNIFYIPEGEKAPVPQMVENCEACADTIAHNLICDLTGTGEKEAYKPAFHGAMACVGGRYGVAYVGLPGKFFGLPSFLAMLSKHFINVIYFIQVLGWNKIFSYISHEFFTIRNKRSFLGGHFSNRSASFFLVPLRLFLGFYWLYEGVVKVGQGWLTTPKLTGFFNGANQFYENILNGGGAVAAASGETAAADTAAAATAAASGAVEAAPAAADAVAAVSGATAEAGAAVTEAVAAASDAVASASGAAATTSGVLCDFNFLGFIRILLVDAGEIALKIQVSFVDWMVQNLILSSDGMQMLFQIVIVLAEILVGLALMAGLFTTLAGGVSILLMSMFLTSTGLYMGSQWWMFFAGIAMLFGAGRVLSLDYYVMPWLKSKWKNVKFAKKWYLYHD